MHDVDIFTLSNHQLDAIPGGQKLAYVRYVSRQPRRVTQPVLDEVAVFPILGLSKFALQLSCAYPPDVSAALVSQLSYEVYKYRANGSKVMLWSGVCSPFYDQVDKEAWVLCERVGLWLGTPNTGTTPPRPVTASFTVVVTT